MISEKMNKKESGTGGYSGRAGNPGTGCALARTCRIFRAMRWRVGGRAGTGCALARICRIFREPCGGEGKKKGHTIIYI